MRPVLREICVESPQPGTSYKAAGGQCSGEAPGRPLGASEAVELKPVWRLGLQKDRQAELRQDPERKLGRFPEPELDVEAS